MASASAVNAYIDRCLDYTSPEAAEKEARSQLWADLAKWAFAQEPEIPRDLSTAAADALLAKASREVKGLRSVAAWQSAARYFEAENFHALTVPACLHARRLETQAKPKAKMKANAKAKTKMKKKRKSRRGN
jgi:hypothetical protein